MERLAAVRPRWLIIPLVVLAGSALAGNALAPTLVTTQPLALLGLNATTRHLLLTSTTVDPVPWFVVALVRRSLEDPLLYLLGVRFGDDALDWFERHFGGGRLLRATQRAFRRFGWVLVALFPGGLICLLAGASGMSFGVFLGLALAGTLATVALLRVFGESLSGPVDLALAFTAENWLWLTVLSVVINLVLLARQHRARRRAR
ncbi:hypothetical protein BH20ACT2_BH20ACT2_25950 [soil metagenome]